MIEYFLGFLQVLGGAVLVGIMCGLIYALWDRVHEGSSRVCYRLGDLERAVYRLEEESRVRKTKKSRKRS